jgi:hypothetical protein
MVDIESKNKEIAETPVRADGAPVAMVMQKGEKSPVSPDLAVEKATTRVSEGEKWFNRILYNVLNYWVNLGISLAVTDFFMHGHGKGFFHRRVKNISDKLVSAGMGRVGANRVAEIGISTFTLNSGGNILLVPTKIAEDNKRPIVHWLNKHVFGDKQLAADGHEKTPDEIYIEQEQPPQSWSRMIFRRFMGLVATTSTGLAIDTALAKKLDKPIPVEGGMITHKPGQEVFTETVVNGAKYALDGVSGGKLGKSITKGSAADRYMSYAALDWIYTKITSTILHRTNGAGKAKTPKEIGDDFDPPGVLAEDEIKRPGTSNRVAEIKAKKAPAETPLTLEEKYKKKPVTSAGKYADMAKTTSEPDYPAVP